MLCGIRMQGEGNIQPSETDTNHLYERIYSWHQMNKDKAQLSAQDRKKYLGLVRDLPNPEDASAADIAFVCTEIDDGIMAWSKDEEDEKGIKMTGYVRKAIGKLGGSLRTYSMAEKSNLALKYWPRIHTLKRVLAHLSQEELRQIYVQYKQETKISEKPDKAFITKKIIDEIPSDRLFGDPRVSKILSDEFDQLYLFFKSHILSLDKPQIDNICKELGQEALAKKYKDKNKLVSELLEIIPIHNVLQNSTVERKLKAKPDVKANIRSLESVIKALSADLKRLSEKDSQAVPYLEELQQRVHQLSVQQEKLTQLLNMKNAPASMTLLEAFRKELMTIDDAISPEKLCEIIDNVQSKLHTDEIHFALKGLEIMFSHYLSQQTKNMSWKPDFQEFIRALKEEIPRAQILPNQAEIPTIRERVTTKLGISESSFDQQLVQAWKEGYVTLHAGAPIGREQVKYLKYEQSEYFYVRLL